MQACSLASDKLANLIFNTARRYDLLFGKHTEMYLKNENVINKKALSSAFVAKTIDDIVTTLNDADLKELLATLICDTTDEVVSKCSNDGLISVQVLPRLYSFYVYCIYFIPAPWKEAVRSLESVFYRDMTRVYDRYLVAQTVMTNLFKQITDNVLNTMFGTRNRT
jgi:hypothetical protein